MTRRIWIYPFLYLLAALAFWLTGSYFFLKRAAAKWEVCTVRMKGGEDEDEQKKKERRTKEWKFLSTSLAATVATRWRRRRMQQQLDGATVKGVLSSYLLPFFITRYQLIGWSKCVWMNGDEQQCVFVLKTESISHFILHISTYYRVARLNRACWTKNVRNITANFFLSRFTFQRLLCRPHSKYLWQSWYMALFIICCLILLLQCNLIDTLFCQGRFISVTKYIHLLSFYWRWTMTSRPNHGKIFPSFKKSWQIIFSRSCIFWK